MNACEIM